MGTDLLSIIVAADAATVQVDTFEAVKNNVYSVLGDLAKDLHGPELDLLFSKFEACTGWPAPDTLKAMDLLKQLAQSDDKVPLAPVLLELCIAIGHITGLLKRFTTF